jgi:hypothetical protein
MWQLSSSALAKLVAWLKRNEQFFRLSGEYDLGVAAYTGE